MEEYVEVYAAGDVAFAYLMKANLENAGIPARITNEHLQGGLCVDGMVPCVLVEAKYAEQARRIIEEIRQASQQDEDADEQEQ